MPVFLHRVMSRLRASALHIFLAFAYVTSGMLGLMLALPPGYASPIFPPAGIAVAACFIGGRKWLPAIFIGSLLLNLWVGYSPSEQLTIKDVQVAAVIALASMLQAAAGGWALRKLIGHPAVFDNQRDIVRFLLLVPLICLVSATLSVTSLWGLGLVATQQFASNWASWWFGDAFGVIVLFPLTMMVAGEPRELWRSRIRTIALPILVVLGTGLTAIYFLQNAALNTAREIQQDIFDYQVRETTLRIEQRLGIYEQALRSLKGLYLASSHVDRAEFRSYVESLGMQKHYPGIQGLGVSLAIPPRELAAHIADVRNEGLTGYDVRPKGVREIYTAIIYLEPFSGRNLRAIGYDMYSEPIRRAAMERSRDQDNSALSGKVKLVQENGENEQAGFLMYLPLYKVGGEHDTVESRRANIVGWVYCAFRMDDLMRGILGEQIDNIDLEIFDGVNPSYENLMHHSQPLLHSGDPLFQSVRQIKIGGHSWTIRLHSLPAFEAGIDTGKVTVIRISGLLMMLLLSMLVWQLAGGRAQAVKLAQDMTRELRRSEAQLNEAQGMAHIGSWERDLASGVVRWSGEMYRILERDANTGAIAFESFLEAIHPDDRPLVKSTYVSALKNGLSYSIEHRLLLSGGRIKFVHHHGEASYDERGLAIRCSGTLQDITRRKLSEQMLQKSYAEIEDLYNRAPCGYHSLDKDGVIRRINDTELSWVGYTQDEVVGKKKWVELITPESAKNFEDHFPLFMKRGYVRDLEFELLRKDGTTFTGLINATAIYDDDGNFLMSRSTVFDITERKSSEKLIHELAFYDTLTHLANRRLLHDRLAHALAASQRSGRFGALMFLDLDNFKPLNDNHGHDVGDLLLAEVARRISACVRESDTVSRFGGDEFAVLLGELDADETESIRQAGIVAEKIRLSLAQPYELTLQPGSSGSAIVKHYCTSSIGVMLFAGHEFNPEELLKRADIAMYKAKESGRNCIQFHSRDRG